VGGLARKFFEVELHDFMFTWTLKSGWDGMGCLMDGYKDMDRYKDDEPRRYRLPLMRTGV
jgi:hypothetical protein